MGGVTTRKSDATEISGFTYTLDLTGNRLSMAITGTAYTPSAVGYTYDDAYQLTGETRTGGNAYSQAFTYDPRGDRTNKVLTDAGTGQEIKGAGSGDYSYDESGNVTRTDDGVNINAYSYDSEGYLTSYHHTGVGGEVSVSYAYDADKRRIRKTVGSTTTRYFYDGSDVVEDYDGGGNLLASYVTPGLDNNLSVTIGGNTYYYTKDGLGSVRNILNTSQTAVNTYDYYAYGAPLGSYSQSVTNRYTYTGREYDSESGLYYYRARYYNGDGRFLSKDPISPWGYVYVRNDPVARTDPDGLRDYFHGSDLPRHARSGTKGPNEEDMVYISHGWDNGFLRECERLYTPNYWRLNSIADFKPNQQHKPCHCISSMLICAHAAFSPSPLYGRMDIGSDSLFQGTYPSPSGTINANAISGMFRNVEFCKKCHIELRSCHLGLIPGLKEQIETVTGCSVKLHKRVVFADGSEGDY